MKPLTVTSCQAENTFAITEAVAAYLQRKIGIPFVVETAVHWQERYRLLDEGEIDIGWICGLPYVLLVDRASPTIELLAAPVMQGSRYQNQPIYYSDVVVRHEAPYRSFAALRGASWAFNEPHSQSGHYITRYHLAKMGETAAFFSRIINSGSHINSLNMVLQQKVDATAIDSTVLEWALQKKPFLTQKIRIIDTFEPSPIPPLIIQKAVPLLIRRQIQQALLQLHESENGRDLLNLGQLTRFEAVTDADYVRIRHMAYTARHVARFETMRS